MIALPGAWATSPVSAARAQLVKPLDQRTPTGSLFYLTTSSAWETGQCMIRANTLIAGQVASWSRRKEGATWDELGIRFEPVACYGSEILQIVPILVAVHGPREAVDDVGLQEEEIKHAMMSMAADRGGMTSGGGSLSPGRAMTGAESQQLHGIDRKHELNNSFRTGEVRDVHGVKMALPAAGSDITRLLSSHSITLQAGTQFYLAFVGSTSIIQPARESASAGTSDSGRIGNAEAARPEAAHAFEEAPENDQASTANQLEICATGCAELDRTPVVAGGPAAWSLSLANLGLRPRMGQLRTALDDDASVHFLGDDQVLVTFNYHSLTRRSADAGARPRQMRAVLLSRNDGHIVHVQEWPVYDDNQYTWNVGDGRVLAHVGHELLILGKNLAVEGRYAFAGPLIFVEVAPFAAGKNSTDGFVAVATLHEKHTPEVHQKLARFFGPDWIDEDYSLTMLGSDLQAIGTKTLDAKPAPVALLTSGMITPHRDRGQTWKIEQLGWDGTSITLAHLTSGCDPGVTALPADLLFTTTCAGDRRSSFYRILNGHGSALLSGHALELEFVQQAASSTAGDVVAVATTESRQPIDLKVGAKVSDFHSLDVSAYRVSDGKRVLVVREPQGSILRQTFALAPNGSSMAVLAGSTLQVYAVSLGGRTAGLSKIIVSNRADFPAR